MGEKADCISEDIEHYPMWSMGIDHAPKILLAVPQILDNIVNIRKQAARDMMEVA